MQALAPLLLLFPYVGFLVIFGLSFIWLNLTHSLWLSSPVLHKPLGWYMSLSSELPYIICVSPQIALYWLLCPSFHYTLSFSCSHSAFCSSWPVKCQMPTRCFERALNLELSTRVQTLSFPCIIPVTLISHLPCLRYTSLPTIILFTFQRKTKDQRRWCKCSL